MHGKISLIPRCNNRHFQLCQCTVHKLYSEFVNSKKEMADDLEQNTAYMLTDSVLRLITMAAVTIPAVTVIAVIIHKKTLHKFHYWFVINLMICDIITALTINPFYIALYLIKLFSTAKLSVHCGYMFAFLYIAPISSGFMVLNLTIDAVLAITYPLKYGDLMTKNKVVIMVAIAWMLAASLTLPLIASPNLDVEVDDLSSCPYTISGLLVLPFVRIVMAIAIIGFNIYLYWRFFKARQKLKCLVEVSTEECSSKTKNLKARMKKYKLFARLSITLLLIMVVDGLLRVLRVISSIIAVEHDFVNDLSFMLFFSLATWAEYINHPVVYGLMLREVYQSVFCKVNNNDNILRS